MTTLRLTEIDRAGLGVLALRELGARPGLTLARDVADALGWNRRTGGPRLRRLVRLGLAYASPVKTRPGTPDDPRDGYGLTPQGREVVGPIEKRTEAQLVGAYQMCERLLTSTRFFKAQREVIEEQAALVREQLELLGVKFEAAA